MLCHYAVVISHSHFCCKLVGDVAVLFFFCFFLFFLRLHFSLLCVVCLSVAAYSGEIKIHIIYKVIRYGDVFLIFLVK